MAMTKKEKSARAWARKQLQDEGLLPLPKKRVNRRQLNEEVHKMYKEEPISLYEIGNAVRKVLPLENAPHISDEEATALKIVKLAFLNRDFMRKIKAKGETSVSADEYMREVYFKVFPMPEYKKRSDSDETG